MLSFLSSGYRVPGFEFRIALTLLLLFTISANAQDIGDLTQRFVQVSNQDALTAGKIKTSTFAIQQIEDAFNGIVLKGMSTGDYRGGAVRFLDDGRWSEWKPLLYLEANTAPTFLAGYRDEIYRENATIELRFETTADVTIALQAIGVFDNRDDADHAPLTAPAANEQSPITHSLAIVPPSLIPRAAWGAEPFIGTPVPLAQPSYTRMTFHHAACCAARTREEGLAQVKAIQDFHQDVRGWSDIGYQFLMDQEGRIYQGRPFMDNSTSLNQPPRLAQGAHVGGANTGNIGVSILGCYHPPENPTTCIDELSPAARDSLETMFAYLSERYQVDASDLFGHRDQGATSCPGDNNYALLPSIRVRIRELISTGNAPIAAAALTAMEGSEGVVQLNWNFSEIIDVDRYRIDRILNDEVITIFASTDLNAVQAVDVTLPTGGDVTYALYATSSTGREQRLSSALIQVDLPDAFTLSGNFPNPFFQSTTIRYYLEQDGVVKLNVFDTRGRLIKSLVDAYQEGGSWYSSSFDANQLASGSYFYRMTVEGFSSIIFDETRSLTLVR